MSDYYFKGVSCRRKNRLGYFKEAKATENRLGYFKEAKATENRLGYFKEAKATENKMCVSREKSDKIIGFNSVFCKNCCLKTEDIYKKNNSRSVFLRNV